MGTALLQNMEMQCALSRYVRTHQHDMAVMLHICFSRPHIQRSQFEPLAIDQLIDPSMISQQDIATFGYNIIYN